MKRALRFLADYWYIPALIGGAMLLCILTGGKKRAIETIDRELDAIRAGAAAREQQLLLGKERAAAEVRREHAAQLVRLKSEQAAKTRRLRNDPVALSKFLIRAGRPDG